MGIRRDTSQFEGDGEIMMDIRGCMKGKNKSSLLHSWGLKTKIIKKIYNYNYFLRNTKKKKTKNKSQ